MLRIASVDDLDLVKSLLDEFLSDEKYTGIYKYYSFTDDIIKMFLDPASHRERIGLVIENKDNEPIGFVAFEKLDSVYSSFKVSRILPLYIKPKYRKRGYMNEVMDAFEYWGKLVGTSHHIVGVSNEWADLTKRGYEKYEVMYIKEVNNG